ncbi:hypothetical protein VTH06DRAFT_954 [Thermothelomyces fergusii]
MTPPPQRGGQDRLMKSPAEKELDEARRLANTSTLNRLASKLKADPAADLTQTLKQQADAYPQLRRGLEQAAREKAAARGSGSGSESESRSAGPSDTQLRPFFAEGPVEIIHALDRRITALLGLTDPQNAAELATRVNEAIEHAEVLWRLHETVVLGLGPSVVVKIGTSLDADEVENLRYINAHVPDVPAPSSLGCLRAGRKTYHFMSRAAGVTLESVWADLSAEHKASVKAQLDSVFCSLRKERGGGGSSSQKYFGGFVSAICKDTRRHQRLSEPRIQTETQFNDFLCRKPGRDPTPWIAMLRSGMRNDHRLVMTHGDLHPRNIMVRWEPRDEDEANLNMCGEGKGIRITALIDWEMSGWYPEYWEFVKALSINPRGKLSDWFEYLPTDAIGTWPVELAIDSLLDRSLA